MNVPPEMSKLLYQKNLKKVEQQRAIDSSSKYTVKTQKKEN